MAEMEVRVEEERRAAQLEAEAQQQDALNRVMEERRVAQATLAAHEQRARAQVEGAAQRAEALTVEQARAWSHVREQEWA